VASGAGRYFDVSAQDALRDDHLSIVVFGPGFGESIAVRGPDGRWLVVDSLRDAGSEDNPALALLRAFDARPELLVLTHAHEDHAAGFADLVERQAGTEGRTGCVPLALPADDDPLRNPDAGAALRTGRTRVALAAIQARWDSAPSSRWLLVANDRAMLGQVDVQVLSPRPGLVGMPGVARNRLSAAVLLRWGEVRVVLGADLPSGEWGRVDTAIQLGIHLLFKVSHHGSKRSQHDRFGEGRTNARTWVVTPWTKAGRHLPRLGDDEDLDGLLCLADGVELTSPPASVSEMPQGPVTRAELYNLIERATFGGDDLLVEYDDHPRTSAEAWVAAALGADGALVELRRGASALTVRP
jgi:hypothetical protein